jgi:hypothetical protein
MIVGNRPYLINREPYSTHASLIADRGFEITREMRDRISGIPRNKLASRWVVMSDDDLVTSGAVVQARLKAPSERRTLTANHRTAVLS